MVLELTEYEARFRKMVTIVREVLGVEMIVVDRWLYTLVNTFNYGDNPVDVRLNSVVGTIIVSGRAQVIRNKTENEVCLGCKDYDRCEMEGVIGVPVMDGDECAGALAMLVRSSNTELFRHADAIVSFLTGLAQMIVKSIRTDAAKQELRDLTADLFDLLDDLEGPVACLTKDLRIRHVNSAFCSFFSVRADGVRGRLLRDVLSVHRVQSGTRLETGDLFTGSTGALARLELSKEKHPAGDLFSRIVYFKLLPVRDYLTRAYSFPAEEKLASFFGPSEQMREAGRCAEAALRNHLPVLIEGPDAAFSRELMQLLGRCGQEEDFFPEIVECESDAADLERLLFGRGPDRPGLLVPLAAEAVCLSGVEKMPRYLQQKLAAFITEQQERSDIRRKVRLFASASCSLHDLAERGRFAPSLLRLIEKNRIVLPDVGASRADREYYFLRFLREYCAVYNRAEIEVQKTALAALLKDERMGLAALREAAESFAARLRGNLLRREDVDALYEGGADQNGPEDKPEQLLHLKELLDEGYSKTRIAKKLGISRATLYRRLEEMKE